MTLPTIVLACLLAGAILCWGCSSSGERHEFTARGGLGESPEAPDAFIFAYFVKNGEDGLHLASSADGLAWTPLNGGRPCLAPQVGQDRLLRDPSITRGPDGRFHMVWTTGWHDPAIGYAHSDDLVHWSAQQLLPVMAHEPAARNAWAPEIFYDDATRQFLIVWASTIPGRFPETDGSCEEDWNHRLYCTTTRDFDAFSPTELFYDPGYSVIDGFVTHGGRGYLLAVKNETLRPAAAKHIYLATAQDLMGPYKVSSKPVTEAWTEGPCLLRVKGRWLLYYDCYNAGRFGVRASADLVNWTDLSNLLQMPAGAHHGTMFRVAKGVVEGLQAAR